MHRKLPVVQQMAYAFDDKLSIGNWNDIVECLINGDVDIEMYTLMGQKVLSQTVKRVGLMALEYVKEIVPGGYMMRVGEWVRKLVIE